MLTNLHGILRLGQVPCLCIRKQEEIQGLLEMMVMRWRFEGLVMNERVTDCMDYSLFAPMRTFPIVGINECKALFP